MKIPTAADLEQAAAEKSISIARLCRLADTPESTFYRYKNGGGITTTTLRAFLDALESVERG